MIIFNVTVRLRVTQCISLHYLPSIKAQCHASVRFLVCRLVLGIQSTGVGRDPTDKLH